MASKKRKKFSGKRKSMQRKQSIKPGPKGPRLDPSQRKQTISIRLAPWLIRWLRCQENQSKTIESALISTYDLSESIGDSTDEN